MDSRDRRAAGYRPREPAADVLAAGANVLQATAGKFVVALKHLEVAMLVAGMQDERGANGEMIGRDAGGGAGDPARTVDDLLAEVVEKVSVVLNGEVAVIELADDGNVPQLLFKLKPDQSQLADKLLGERV